MKLLFDQNLSFRLVALLLDCYPGSAHVRERGLANADDTAVWSHAAEYGLTIVSKDSDFHQRSLLYGPPPKVVWIQRGNCTTSDVAQILRQHRQDIASLEQNATAAFLIID